jgi:hypothetical protein
MAIEYILFTDFSASAEELRNGLVNSAGFSEEEDFRDFSCAYAEGIQLLCGSAKERTLSGSIGSESWLLSARQEVFFTLDKNEHYEAGKMNLVMAALFLLKKYAGDALLINNENREHPVLLKYDGRLWLSANPGNDFWDKAYEPDVFSLVDVPCDLAVISMEE